MPIPDGAYVGSGLNILIGNHTSYLDHPGLPTQDALALAFGAWYLVDRARGDDAGRTAFFVDRRMLDLDGSRWLYRGWAIATFASGQLLVALLMGRLFGHWSWGVAGGVLFLAAPGLAEIAHRLRPDAILTAASVAVAYLVVTGIEGRSAPRYLGAAVVFGLAMTVKISVLGCNPHCRRGHLVPARGRMASPALSLLALSAGRRGLRSPVPWPAGSSSA